MRIACHMKLYCTGRQNDEIKSRRKLPEISKIKATENFYDYGKQ